MTSFVALAHRSDRHPPWTRRPSIRPTLECLEARVVLASTVFTWTGAASNLWSNAGNWSPGQVPTSSALTDLVFPAGAANQSMVNDLDGAAFGTLAFQAGGYSVAGDAIDVMMVSNVAGTNTIEIPLSLTSSGSNLAAASGSTLNVDASLNIGSNGTFLNQANVGDYPVDGVGAVNLGGPVSGVGPILTTGIGAVTLSTDNTYLGGTNIQGGLVVVGANSSLGTGPVTFGVLESNAPVSLPNAFTITAGGGTFQGGSSVTLTGTGTLSGPLSVNFPVSTPTVTLAGPLSGSGSINVNRGNLVLSGTNNFTGGTNIQGGTLVIGSATALGSGALTLGGVIQASGTQAVANAFQVNSASQVSGSGNLTFSGAGLLASGLTVASAGTTTFSGVLSGAGGLTTTGSGTLVLTGADSLSGQNQFLVGTVIVDGALGSGTVNLAATLMGTGTVGPITTIGGSTIAPGSSGNTGVLTSSGTVVLAPGVNFAVALNGKSAGTSYDQLVVNSGGIALAGAALKPTLGYQPSVGDVLTIISSPGGVSGTFNGLANGSVVSIGKQPFQINYTSNAVTLTAVSSAQAAALFNLTPYVQLLQAGPSQTSADINGDGTPDLIAVRSSKSGLFVIVNNGRTGGRLLTIRVNTPFRHSRVRVAAADVNGDGTPDIIVASGPARRPFFDVYSGRDGSLLRRFSAATPALQAARRSPG